MAKRLSPERLDGIVETALAHFLRHGYRRARIDRIAKDAGVSAGSVYNYCASKEALFDLCLRRAFGDSQLPEALPHSLHPSTSVIDRAWETFVSSTRFEVIAAVHEGRAAGVYTLDEIAEFLYDWIDTHGTGIRLMERCSSDWPELAHYYSATFRTPGLSGLADALDEEVRANRAAEVGPSDITARIIVEICAYFAMHRRKDPLDLSDRDDEVRATVLEFIKLALRPRRHSRSRREETSKR